MIDAHCHLNFHSFESDYDQVIKNAQAAGVKVIINAGTQINSSKKAIDLAGKHENLFAVIAIHPHHADKLEPAWLKELENLAKHPKVIGIGECGLDYYNYQSNGIVDPSIQKKVFIKHMELSHKLKLPLQIHSRDENARKDILGILYTHKNLLQTVPGMFHCVAGSKELLKKALDLGFYIGFDGNITYKGVPQGEPLNLEELVKYTPLDRIVVETDSPYLSPIPYRGQRNEPKYAIIIAKFIAQLKNIPFEKIVEQTDKNVYTVFRKLKIKS
ncbi:TatD family hydrolase [Patescibacteria group bacterium]|nr:TatD family hydrolase [Patescibacteria group bacterium]